MLIFRNSNHFGDCLLQLGLLKMLREQHKVEVGFVVTERLQWEAIKTTKFISYKIWQDRSYNPKPEEGDDFINLATDFIPDDSARGKMSLIKMWAQSIPYKLTGEMKPFIQLMPEDYKEAHKLKLKGKVFVAPFKVTCLVDPGLYEGQQYLQSLLVGKGYYLLGAKGDPEWEGFWPLVGLPIRVVAVLLKEGKALYCINNGITNLAWAVGLKQIWEWVTPITAWAKVPYSRQLN